ncbi:MAG: DUF2330 domain-containing protein, partial [Gemmataceae bacterium]|nr:DUF2330 domain-containing protein [Gemmataceae bacterium]
TPCVRVLCAVALGLLAGLVCLPDPVGACAVAPPQGVVVEVASESAVIVWDEKAKTEHFIRRATFQPVASVGGPVVVKDFGFLVPTPSIPALGEVPDAAFDDLAKLTEPKTVYEKRSSGGGGCALGCGMMGAKSQAPAEFGERHAVQIVAEKHVAGYDAKVIKADDADALTAWLKDHGYETRPALAGWLQPYLDKKWVVTAFKIGREPSQQANGPIGSTAVRMSFTTDKPFYPYREPADARDAKTRRLLRVFFIGPQKVAGELDGKGAWDAKTVWAGKPGADGLGVGAPGWKGALATLKVPGFEPTADTWLTEFEDPSSPRKGDADVFFGPAGSDAPVERPARVIYVSRADGAAPFAGVGVAVACLYLTRFFAAWRRRA